MTRTHKAPKQVPHLYHIYVVEQWVGVVQLELATNAKLLRTCPRLDLAQLTTPGVSCHYPTHTTNTRYKRTNRRPTDVSASPMALSPKKVVSLYRSPFSSYLNCARHENTAQQEHADMQYHILCIGDSDNQLRVVFILRVT